MSVNNILNDFQKEILEGIPAQIPQPKAYDKSVNLECLVKNGYHDVYFTDDAFECSVEPAAAGAAGAACCWPIA